MGNPDMMSGKLTQNCWFGFEGRSARLILISRKNAEDENTAEKNSYTCDKLNTMTDYRQWGAKSRILRFSKSGNPVLEKLHATHYTGKKNSVIEA